MRNTRILFTFFAAFIVQPVWAADPVVNPWLELSPDHAARAALVDKARRNVSVAEGRRLSADLQRVAAEFRAEDGLSVVVPLPDGSQATYRLRRSPVMASALAEKYPDIQTFSGYDIDRPTNKGSFDLTPHGFHGMFKHNGKWVFIDPEVRGDISRYVVYYSQNALPLAKRTADKVLKKPSLLSDGGMQFKHGSKPPVHGSRPVVGDKLRTYRLAVSASAEYTAFHGGTVKGGLSALATLVARINEVYLRDLAVRFELVAENDKIIYTNKDSDPFNNTDEDLEGNSSVIDGAIGKNNYDIGHVVNTGGGGLAMLGGICEDGGKAAGMTGMDTPTGDAFHIDYVAHEIGHQLGANHTFNGTKSGCDGNRNATTAWEPGSGSTIMGYAGICDSQNLQNSSGDFFHIGSIEEMRTTLDGKDKSCGTTSTLANAAPTVNAGNDYVIPANTPFKLTGSAQDGDGDTLSYSWEEYDTGEATEGVNDMKDNGNRPLFRSWGLRNTAERYFPRLEDVLVKEGYTTIGESYPTTDRKLTFRLTARDGKGGVATDEAVMTVKTSAGPFKVTEPTESSTWTKGKKAVIRWDVANTDVSPVNCGQVDILLSTDSGMKFDKTIASSVKNDGQFEYTVNSSSGSNNRVMVRCADNVFFAVNPGNFVTRAGSSDGSEPTPPSGSSPSNPVPNNPPPSDSSTSETNAPAKSGGGAFGFWLLQLIGLVAVGRYFTLLSARRRVNDHDQAVECGE
ncbi:MAG: hypothetical protein CSB47_00590 [Proteobacteria bacterium]|nr:MAG: hypothetical protein CSB47_00590 [Pseudomonadota bacterium]